MNTEMVVETRLTHPLGLRKPGSGARDLGRVRGDPLLLDVARGIDYKGGNQRRRSYRSLTRVPVPRNESVVNSGYNNGVSSSEYLVSCRDRIVR